MNASHPELEALADLLDEPNGVAGEPGLAAHVAGCSQCRADLRALRTVQQTLRALPAVPMPDAVAARLESAMRAGAIESGAAPARELSAESGRRKRAWIGFQLPHLSAAAGVVVLLVIALGTGIAVMVTHAGTSNGRTAASTAAGVAAKGSGVATVVTASGVDYQQATIRSQVAALVVERVPGSAKRYSGLQPLAGHAAAGMAVPAKTQAAVAAQASAASKPSASAGGNFAPAGSPGSNKALTDSAIAPARTAPGGPLADPAALRACVRTLNGGTPVEPVLVDYARYDGRPATIIVLPSSQSQGKLVVWVEPDGSDCATEGETAYYGSLSAAS